MIYFDTQVVDWIKANKYVFDTIAWYCQNSNMWIENKSCGQGFVSTSTNKCNQICRLPPTERELEIVITMTSELTQEDDSSWWNQSLS